MMDYEVTWFITVYWRFIVPMGYHGIRMQRASMMAWLAAIWHGICGLQWFPRIVIGPDCSFPESSSTDATTPVGTWIQDEKGLDEFEDWIVPQHLCETYAEVFGIWWRRLWSLGDRLVTGGHWNVYHRTLGYNRSCLEKRPIAAMKNRDWPR